jgi:hypothetical protein
MNLRPSIRRAPLPAALGIVVALLGIVRHTAATEVTFAADGTCRVDGKPFFPIGVWVYGLSSDVIADLEEHRFNTVVGNGLKATDLPVLEKHGLKCIAPVSDEWLAAAKASPSLLAWYLIDEPEEHGTTPEQVRAIYEQLKTKDKSHPAGITHDMLIGPPKYKGSCDFTMTDVYPVTRDRNWPLNAVGRYTENTRKVHGEGWANFTFIQTFGGPDSDGGKWAQPLPHEVRFMAFNALVHRAAGILYFSYWPRDKVTWASVTKLNRDLNRLVPWLLAPGEEKAAKSDEAAVEVRAKKVGGGWMVIATNDEPKPCRATLSVDGLSDGVLRVPFEGRTVGVEGGKWQERFAAHEVHAYLMGDEPRLP